MADVQSSRLASRYSARIRAITSDAGKISPMAATLWPAPQISRQVLAISADLRFSRGVFHGAVVADSEPFGQISDPDRVPTGKPLIASSA
jgi:hypothetical protein